MTEVRAKLADVARLSGVSMTSASMALSDSPRVADATKVRVRDAADRLGYVPHSGASALRSQRSDAIAVVVPHDNQHVLSHPYFMDLVHGVLEVTNEHDISAILSTARTPDDETSAYSRILRGRRASGVIVAAASTTDANVAGLVDAGYPVIVVGRAPGVPDVISVGLDDEAGAAAAVQHLTEVHGARRIGHVSGPLTHQSAIDKRAGYHRILAAAGLVADPRLQFEGDYTEASGAAAAHALLPSLAECDALFFANDQMAAAAMDVLLQHGVDIPGEVAIVGYDDHPVLRQHTRPPLTTVGADMVELGSAAMLRLIALMRGTRPENLELPTHLIVRESCGCTDPGTPGSATPAPTTPSRKTTGEVPR